jgi:hypothetical protein
MIEKEAYTLVIVQNRKLLAILRKKEEARHCRYSAKRTERTPNTAKNQGTLTDVEVGEVPWLLLRIMDSRRAPLQVHHEANCARCPIMQAGNSCNTCGRNNRPSIRVNQ